MQVYDDVTGALARWKRAAMARLNSVERNALRARLQHEDERRKIATFLAASSLPPGRLEPTDAEVRRAQVWIDTFLEDQ